MGKSVYDKSSTIEENCWNLIRMIFILSHNFTIYSRIMNRFVTADRKVFVVVILSKLFALSDTSGTDNMDKGS